jgi:hypothetical protein
MVRRSTSLLDSSGIACEDGFDIHPPAGAFEQFIAAPLAVAMGRTTARFARRCRIPAVFRLAGSGIVVGAWNVLKNAQIAWADPRFFFIVGPFLSSIPLLTVLILFGGGLLTGSRNVQFARNDDAIGQKPRGLATHSGRDTSSGHRVPFEQSSRLIWSWSFRALDDQDIDRTSLGEEFQAELVAKGFDQSYPGSIA